MILKGGRSKLAFQILAKSFPGGELLGSMHPLKPHQGCPDHVKRSNMKALVKRGIVDLKKLF